MFSFFSKKNVSEKVLPDFIRVDMHSHILPGLDDGSEDIEESKAILERFVQLGYKKAILTPHVMGDSYQNTPDGIREKLTLLKPIANQLGIVIEAAAEYYIDDSFYHKITDGEEILSFGEKKYVLIETSYINESSILTHVTFELQARGYVPVLAHPERYTYMFGNFKRYEDLFDRGLLLQVNLNSLAGYYSPESQKIAERLIDKKMLHFVGTDCHSPKHTYVTQKAMLTKHYQKLKDVPLLNNTLL
jgi:protein-tyrosine phosphatase